MEKEVYYTIGEVVERTGLTHRTLRHYENFFNMNINRDLSGSRIYSEEDLDIIESIVDLKKKSLKLEGIKTILIEKNMIPAQEPKDIVLIDPKALEAKEFLVAEIKNAVNESLSSNPSILQLLEEFSETRKINESLQEENKELKDLLANFTNNTTETLQNIGSSIESLKTDKSLPWYKRLFK